MRVYTLFGERDRKSSWDHSPRERLHLVLAALRGSTQLLDLHIDPVRYQGSGDDVCVRNPSFQAAAKRSFLDEMNFLASAWIDSGKSFDGCDDLRDRHVGKSPKLDYPLALRLIRALSGVRLWMPDVLMPDGRPAAGSDVQFFFFDSTTMVGTFDDQGSSFGHQVAAYWFRRLLDSDYSRHFSKCDHCGAFFEYDKIPRKPISRGIFCDEHKNRGSHMRNVVSRENKTQRIVNAAADIWNSCPHTRLSGRERWVAERISKVLDIDIKQNTITRHKDAILERLRLNEKN